jgi:hypothetical protein
MPRPWGTAEPSARLDEFDHLLLGGAVYDYRKARGGPWAERERASLLRTLHGIGRVYSGGYVFGEGAARPEILQAMRLLEAGDHEAAFAILDTLLLRGVAVEP